MYLITTKCKIKRDGEIQNYICVHICKTKRRAIKTLDEYFGLKERFKTEEALQKSTKEIQKEIQIKLKKMEKEYEKMKKQWPKHFKDTGRKLNIKIEHMEF